MVETAAGLFHNSHAADAVAAGLRAKGFPASGIRTLSEPLSLPVTGPTSTPGTDFAAALRRDLKSMGASNAETDAYLSGLHDGGTLIFATGSTAQVQEAISVMNEHFAVNVEEFAGAVAVLPEVAVGVGAGSESPTNPTIKIEHGRNKTEGPKIFTW